MVQGFLLILFLLIPCTVTSQTDTGTVVSITKKPLKEIVKDLKDYNLCKKELSITDSLLINCEQRMNFKKSIINAQKKVINYKDSIIRQDSLIYRQKKLKLQSKVKKFRSQRNIAGISGIALVVLTFLLSN